MALSRAPDILFRGMRARGLVGPKIYGGTDLDPAEADNLIWRGNCEARPRC